MEIRRYLCDVDRWASIQLPNEYWNTLRNQLNNQEEVSVPKSALEVDYSRGPLPDFISLGPAIPVMSENAWEVIHSHCTACTAHRISLPDSNCPYFVVDIPELNLIDASKAALFRRLSGSVTVDRYAFHPIPQDVSPMFYVPESKYLHILVTQQLIDCVNEHELTGLIFPKLLMADDK